MGYVIPLILVVVLVGGFLVYLVLNATRKSGPAATGDAGEPGVGADPSPLGDTTEHSDQKATEGTPVGPPSASAEPPDPDTAAHVARPGEGEGAERLEFEGERPASESRR
jgi:hypothetical protein